jgi:hypothetical protein
MDPTWLKHVSRWGVRKVSSGICTVSVKTAITAEQPAGLGGFADWKPESDGGP